jgi:hypothetical protein
LAALPYDGAALQRIFVDEVMPAFAPKHASPDAMTTDSAIASETRAFEADVSKLLGSRVILPNSGSWRPIVAVPAWPLERLLSLGAVGRSGQ